MGTAFAQLPDADMVPLLRQDLDLSSPKTIPSVLSAVNPVCVINCAAFTDVDRAEANEELATIVNGVSVGVVSEWCSARAIPLLTFSTDYVFDGDASEPYTESSDVNPVNAYGRSKRQGEVAALVHETTLVVRTSWVISGTHQNFVSTMIRLAAERSLRVVDDQYGCPTIASDLAWSSYEAIKADVRGILHLTNQGVTTWYRLARKAVGLAGLAADRIEPIGSEDYPTPAKRPNYSVLRSERADALGLAAMPHWEHSLPTVVHQIKGELT